MSDSCVSQQLLGLLALKGKRSTVTVPGEHPEAAVLVAILERRGELAVLLTRRARHLTLHAGESAFPGGKRDRDDPDLLTTALREAEEEVALPPEQFELLCTLDQHVTRSGICVTPFVGLIPPDLPLVPNPDEVEQLFTVPLFWLCDPCNLESFEAIYLGKSLRVPRFHYGEFEIIGVTAMALVDLVNLAFGAGLRV